MYRYDQENVNYLQFCGSCILLTGPHISTGHGSGHNRFCMSWLWVARNVSVFHRRLHAQDKLRWWQMHATNNSGNVTTWPRRSRSLHQRTRIIVAYPGHVHHALKFVTTAEAMVEPNTHISDRPVGAINSGKPRNAETDSRGNYERPQPAIFPHGSTPIVWNLAHAPRHLSQIKIVAWNPTHKLVFGNVVSANVVRYGDLSFPATRGHYLHWQRMAMSDQATKSFCHLVEGAWQNQP